jgi:hypothetical protein
LPKSQFFATRKTNFQACVQRGGGFMQAGVSQMFGRAMHFQIRTNVSAGIHPRLPLDKIIMKIISFSKREAEVNFPACKTLRSIARISLPVFPFEFSVEQASNRMIDARSNKGFKAVSTFIYLLPASTPKSIFNHKEHKERTKFTNINI